MRGVNEYRQYWGTWGLYEASGAGVPSTVDCTFSGGTGGLYTGLLWVFRDNSYKYFKPKALSFVHSVGKSGYVFGKMGTPSSTGINLSDRISFSFLL